MPVTVYEINTTVSASEYSMVNNSLTTAQTSADGIVQVFVDFVNLSAIDTYEVRLREAVISGGTQTSVFRSTIVGRQPFAWASPSFIVLNNWDVAIRRTAGSDRVITGSVRLIPAT
jgi:hypothetical protein